MSTFQILITLVIVLLFVVLYFTTLRDPVGYAVKGAAFLLLAAYLVRLLS